MIFGLENRGETSFFMSCHFDQTMYHSDFAFSLFLCTKKNYLWLFCDKNKQNDIFKTSSSKYKSKWNKPNPSRTRANSKLNNGMIFLFQYFLQHFSHIMFSPFICTGWRINGVCAQKKHEWIIWLIWAIVGQYTDKMTQKCVKMSLFVRVVTHYGSNESNDSLGVFSVDEII